MWYCQLMYATKSIVHFLDFSEINMLTGVLCVCVSLDD